MISDVVSVYINSGKVGKVIPDQLLLYLIACYRNPVALCQKMADDWNTAGGMAQAPVERSN